MKPEEEDLNRQEHSEPKTELEKLRENGKRRRKGPAERMWAPIKLHLDEDYRACDEKLGPAFFILFCDVCRNAFWLFVFQDTLGLRRDRKRKMQSS